MERGRADELVGRTSRPLFHGGLDHGPGGRSQRPRRLLAAGAGRDHARNRVRGGLLLRPEVHREPCRGTTASGVAPGKDGQTYQVRQGGNIATALNVPSSEYPAVDRGVANLTNGVDILSDLDDTIGGDFQTNFWSQLQKFVWKSPPIVSSKSDRMSTPFVRFATPRSTAGYSLEGTFRAVAMFPPCRT